ncbi:unnamed protein product, partial [Polarella glacialis]
MASSLGPDGKLASRRLVASSFDSIDPGGKLASRRLVASSPEPAAESPEYEAYTDDVLYGNGGPAMGRVQADQAAFRLATDCAKSVSGNFKDTLSASHLVLRIWEAAAQAIAKDLDAGRGISVQGLGVFGLSAPDRSDHRSPSGSGRNSEQERNALAHPRLPTFIASEEFTELHGLEAEESTDDAQSSGPRAKYSVASAARAADVTKEVAIAALSAFIFRMGQAMSTSRGPLAVTFAPLGTFT